jgi:putative hemolysin
MEYSIGHNRSSFGIFKFMAIVMFVGAVLLTVAYVSAMPNAHAVARHGNEATQAHTCINNGGTVQGTMKRESDGHIATICMMGKFYIYIEDSCGNEVTSMCKNKMSKLDQVINYLTNRGYK